MKLPDLTEKCEASLHISQMTHKRQRNNDAQGNALFDWSVDLTIDLKDTVVEEVPSYLFGAIEKLAAADDGQGSGRVDHVPLDESRAVRVGMTLDGEEVLTDVAGELRFMEVVAVAGASRYRAKLLIAGITGELSGTLLECDRRGIVLSLSPVQVALPLLEAAK